MSPSRTLPPFHSLPPPSLPLSLVSATDLYPTLLSSLRTSFSNSRSLFTAHPHLHSLFPTVPSLPFQPVSLTSSAPASCSVTRFSHSHLMQTEPSPAVPLLHRPSSHDPYP